MPTYTLENTKTGEVWDEFITYNEMMEKTKDPDVKQVFTKMNYHGDGGLKHSTQIREVFQKIKKAHPLSTVDVGNITEI